jgi:hypothetical protein
MKVSQYLIILLTALCLLGAGRSFASEREYAIKSGFLFNFARYSHGRWYSGAPDKSYVICGFEPEFVQAAKRTLSEQRLSGKRVIVRQVQAKEDQLSGCNTLFVSRNDVTKWAHVIDSKALADTMLVGEFDQFIQSGGHIRFYVVAGKVRFEIDPEGLTQAGIEMSSKVLRMGRIYKRDGS